MHGGALLGQHPKDRIDEVVELWNAHWPPLWPRDRRERLGSGTFASFNARIFMNWPCLGAPFLPRPVQQRGEELLRQADVLGEHRHDALQGEANDIVLAVPVVGDQSPVGLGHQVGHLLADLVDVDDPRRGARRPVGLDFTLRSVITETFLDDLRAKTRRGMDGRFHAGQSTGGLAFGFKSSPVSDARGEVNDSQSLFLGLQDREAQLKTDQQLIANVEADVDKPIALPSPAEVLATVNDLDDIIREDPARGREALRTYFRGGSIVMNPLPDEKAYKAEAELLPLAVLLSDPTRKKEKTPPGESGRRRYIPSGCGGAILPLANSVPVEGECPNSYGK